jgi:anthranilate synthase component 1
MTKIDVTTTQFEALPARSAFAERYRKGEPQVVWTRLVADLETPVSAALKLSDGQPISCLLESVEGGAVRGRYSIIGIAPDVVWRAFGDRAEINRRPLEDIAAFEPETLPALESLRALLARSRIVLPPDLPPIAAGVIGYMGYDTVRLIEHLPNARPDALGVPDSVFVRPTIMVVFDAVKDEMIVVTPVHPRSELDAHAAYAEAVERLRRVVAALDEPLPHATAMSGIALALPEPVSNTAPEEFVAMVERAKEYIAAGDIFQVVLAQRYSVPFTLPSFALYRALRRTNPSPFLFHLDFGAFSLVGSSPEILVRVRDGEVTIRPLAGTRRRGATPEEDKALEAELLADPKERAEHLMLLDLGRNDVGRVAEIGSVRVTESFAIERYSHVMHIVSHVLGRLDKKHDVVDALMGGFPAGTLSGAPKVRAMQIIDELEKEKRGPYGGCVGYFSADGEMDSCIVLRTALVKDGVAYVQAGAGIVADSNPTAEQDECQYKARALFKAAEEAVRFAERTRRGNR